MQQTIEGKIERSKKFYCGCRMKSISA